MNFTIESLNRDQHSEIGLIAERMRLTLIEVLGESRGSTMYTLDWLIDRVHFHLDPSRSQGSVFVVRNQDGEIVAHTMVRIETDDNANKIGLFATFYVVPSVRRNGVANLLIRHGEDWMRYNQLKYGATNTGIKNFPLIKLMEKHGYKITFTNDEMLSLTKELSTTQGNKSAGSKSTEKP